MRRSSGGSVTVPNSTIYGIHKCSLQLFAVSFRFVGVLLARVDTPARVDIRDPPWCLDSLLAFINLRSNNNNEAY